MTCTLRILLDGRERLRQDGVSNLQDPAFQQSLRDAIQGLRLLHRKVAVTVIADGVENVIYSGNSR